jgi:hypothetical protein
VPGFFVTRYAFLLIAVVPTYLLLRRLYGVAAGALGIIVLMSSPVLIIAWGTDYPDSAGVSYLAGALACLAMPSRERNRPAWLAAAGALLILAMSSHPSAIPLVGATLIAYAVVLLLRDRKRLLRDGGVLLGAAVVTTGLLVVGSALELGRTNFISLAASGWSFLTSSSFVKTYHSTSWAWAPYRPYLLVLPAVVGAWVVTFARRRPIATPQLVVGLACAAQVLIASYLQFFGTVWSLEMHFNSSLIWGAICVTLAVTVSELARPLAASRILRWLPALVALLVPILFASDPRVPAFGWFPVGIVLMLTITAAAAIGRALTVRATAPGRSSGATAWLVTSLVLVVILGAGLVLTTAPSPAHRPLPNVAHTEQPTDYQLALGDAGSRSVAQYRVETEIPAFVGKAAYDGQQLMIWHPHKGLNQLTYYNGLYGDGLNEIQGFPYLGRSNRWVFEHRRPAKILLMSTTGAQFSTALRSLAPFYSVRVKTRVLRSGPFVLHLWLVDLRRYDRAG